MPYDRKDKQNETDIVARTCTIAPHFHSSSYYMLTALQERSITQVKYVIHNQLLRSRSNFRHRCLLDITRTVCALPEWPRTRAHQLTFARRFTILNCEGSCRVRMVFWYAYPGSDFRVIVLLTLAGPPSQWRAVRNIPRPSRCSLDC